MEQYEGDIYGIPRPQQAYSAQQAAREQKSYERMVEKARADHIRKDAAIQQQVQEAERQTAILKKQLSELKEQNDLLKAESEKSTKEAKKSRVIGIVSLALSAVSVVTSVLLSALI